jgi:Glycosyltransferase family 87
VLLRIEKSTLLRNRQLGVAGAILVVLGGLFAGVPPLHDPVLRLPVFESIRAMVFPGVLVTFVGVSMMLVAWLRLGRLLRATARGGGPDVRTLLTTMAWWAAPLTVALPVFSRDVYSYLAQGTMTVYGIDAYQYGPAILGGPLSINIPSIWQTTPAPYGPTFLSLASDITGVTGESMWFGIFGMRLLALGGLALLAWAVPRVAKACGVDPRQALWLALLNPLALLHLVGDAHNDSLMLGLMMAGLAFALERRPAAGAILVALGALVKAPAGLALLFIVPIWASQLSPQRRGTSRWALAGLGTFGVAAATIVATTAFAGTGYGWIGALDTPTLAHTWTSISTDIGFWAGKAASALGLATEDQVLAWVRLLGLAAAGLLCLALWRRYHATAPVVGLGLGLAVVLALGPVVHPWYLLWATLPLAAAATSPRIRRGVMIVSIAMILTVLPGGVAPTGDAFLAGILGVVLVFGLALAVDRLDWSDPPRSVLASLRLLVRRLWADRTSAYELAPSDVFEREPVTVDAQAADHAGGDGRHNGVVPKRFARMDVRDVNLDQRSRN